MTFHPLKLNSNKTQLSVALSWLEQTSDLLTIPWGQQPRSDHGLRPLILVTKSVFLHLISISRLQPSLLPSLNLLLKNSSMLSSPATLITVLVSCSGPPTKLWTGSSMSMTADPTLDHLHMFLIKLCISYKVPLTYKSLHTLAPQYLSDPLYPQSPSCSLCSSDSGLLSIRHSCLLSVGDLAFRAATHLLLLLFSCVNLQCTVSRHFQKSLVHTGLQSSTSLQSNLGFLENHFIRWHYYFYH